MENRLRNEDGFLHRKKSRKKRLSFAQCKPQKDFSFTYIITKDLRFVNNFLQGFNCYWYTKCQSNVSHLVVKCQSNVSHLVVKCQSLGCHLVVKCQSNVSHLVSKVYPICIQNVSTWLSNASFLCVLHKINV